MRFTIIKTKADASPPEYTCDFLPPGGTIGRSVDNNLVLPDEDRAISRLQAIVHVSADGVCQIINKGTVSKMYLNGSPLIKDKKTTINPGDVLGIAGYKIHAASINDEVTIPQPKSAQDQDNNNNNNNNVFDVTNDNSKPQLGQIELSKQQNNPADDLISSILNNTAPQRSAVKEENNNSNVASSLLVKSAQESKSKVQAKSNVTSSLLSASLLPLEPVKTKKETPTTKHIDSILEKKPATKSELSTVAGTLNKADNNNPSDSAPKFHKEEDIAMNKPTSPKPPTNFSADSDDNSIPMEIWDELIQEFTPKNTNDKSNATKATSLNDVDSIMAAPKQNYNSADPLKGLSDTIDLSQLKQPDANVSQLFDQDIESEKESIFSDNSPSTLTDNKMMPSSTFIDQSAPVASTLTDSVVHSPATQNQPSQMDPMVLFDFPQASIQQQEDPLGMFINSTPLTSVSGGVTDNLNLQNATAPTMQPLSAMQEYTNGQINVFGNAPTMANNQPEQIALVSEHVTQNQPDLMSPPSKQDRADIFTSQEGTINPLPVSQQPGLTEQQTTFDIPLMDEQSEFDPQKLPLRQEEPVIEAVAVTAAVTAAVSSTKSKQSDGRFRVDPVNQSQNTKNRAQHNQEGDILEGDLLDAFLRGVGLDDMNPSPTINSYTMELIGKLMSRYSQGTIALLSSRSILKRGLKDDTTMILEEANNPFKFLPSGKTVLMQMFGSPMPGFMPPEQAVRDALIDLQAHQLGMIAGIRAIIAAMLQSFNPERLDAEFKRQGLARSFGLPGHKKADLWDFFVKSYQKTAGEIEDDFHTLFGEAFLHAYNIEVNQYRDSQVKPE